MNMQEANRQMISILESWDPLGYGPKAYELEIVDVIQAAHSTTNVEKLARRIQAIYELSFEDVIPLPMCKMIAKQLVKLITVSTACEKGLNE